MFLSQWCWELSPLQQRDCPVSCTLEGVCVCVCGKSKNVREKEGKASSSLLCLSSAPSANKRHKNKGQKMKNNEVESSSCACIKFVCMRVDVRVCACMCCTPAAELHPATACMDLHLLFQASNCVSVCVYNELDLNLDVPQCHRHNSWFEFSCWEDSCCVF